MDRRYLAALVAATFLFGSTFPASKLVLTQVGPLWTAAMRFACATLSLLPLVCWQRRRAPLAGRLPLGRLALIGALQTAGSMGFLNLGLRHTAAPRAAILMACTPLLVALLSRLWLKTPIRPLAWTGLGLALCGVVLCVSPGGLAAPQAGDLLVLGGALCWAVATLVIKRMPVVLDIWRLSFWQMLFGSLLLAGLARWQGEPMHWPHAAALAAFVWLALPATTGAMALWFLALQWGGAVRTSGFLFLSPLFATLLSWWLFGRPLSWPEAAGGVLVGAGLYALARGAEAPAEITFVSRCAHVACD
ncbi:DMT family transporter [Paludibacterium purpuratum]|uniref:Drug/metabolite transporter (DMT)-like permease n=1 Tax=Paludibacterium purpuratum TaxID=1144873 RepID=A0A4R7BD66_9NEIS|nr:DMT family transporter [Paludibacterium purpuratum]TDR82918.1 drug/metabolite transporter (DMT)-like permease [Paludibacterium purpuratum]